MRTSKRFAVERMHADKLACGRDASEQIEDIGKYGNHGVSPVLRAGALASHGIVNPKGKADVAVFFGCYRPFTTPFLLRDYLSLMDILEVNYTFFDREYCCGLPLVMQATKDNLERNRQAGRAFNHNNLALAREKGASRLAYCCAGCVYGARSHFPQSNGEHAYILDTICEALNGKAISVAPMTVGYFEGCHTFYKELYPGISLDWARYRETLGRIEGLRIVDLPNKLCCKPSGGKIVEQALKLGLDTVVCSCNGCHAALKVAATGRIRLLSYPTLLLKALGREPFRDF